jgi:hypothetical protein
VYRKESVPLRDFQVRVIHYQHPGGKLERLVTTLLDINQYSASEIINIYHDRWEQGVGFDEIKTHMLRREECLRSKTVEASTRSLGSFVGVQHHSTRDGCRCQEKTSPVKQASFTGAMRLVFNFFLGAQTAGPRKLAREQAGRDELLGKSSSIPPRRSGRRNPRQFKIKMSQYPKTSLRRVTTECVA